MKRFLLFCLIFGPVLVFGWRYPKRRTIFSFALLSVLTLDLFFANRGYYRKYDAKTFHEPSESVGFLKKDTTLFRIATAPKTKKEPIKYSRTFFSHIRVTKEKIMPGFNMQYRLYSMDGAEVSRLANYEGILLLVETSPNADSTNLLALLNVKYVISKFEIDSKEFELSEIIRDKDDPESSLKIYRNVNVLPRAFLVEGYKVVNSEKEYKDILQSKTFHPRELVLLDEDPFVSQGESLSVAFASSGRSPVGDRIATSDIEEGVVITKYEPNMVELAASLNKPKMLFLSETYYPGWKVYIDGNEGTIYRANHSFRAAPLGPGSHKVVFAYKPLSVILGAVITLLGIIATVLILVKPSLRRKILLNNLFSNSDDGLPRPG